MDWNLKDLRFLYPPDDFVGTFTNPLMQSRHEAMRQEKLDRLLNGLSAERSPRGAMNLLHKNDQLRFLLNNTEQFANANELEQTVLFLYLLENTPFSSGGEYTVWQKLFKTCDPQLLKKLGGPIPKGGLTGYRGSVTGKVRGLSWSIDKDKVAWFLNRWSNKDEGGGIICSMQFDTGEILLLLNTDSHQEIIVDGDCMENKQLQEVHALD